MKQFIPLTLRVSLFAISFLVPAPHAMAITIDPFTFCNNTCKLPGACEQKSIADDCKKKCSEDSIWKHVASLQMSSASKDFRMEKDKKKKDSLLYKAPIATCLGLKAETTPPPIDSMMNAKKNEDLCTAALQKEMNALKNDRTALEAQSHELEAAMKALKKVS